MFYLKYRPKSIDEIDNSLVKEKLKKILSTNQFPHALLLAGPKGTGKTSTARIIAKVVNCKKVNFPNKDIVNPCNECDSCKAIDNSTSPDVVEIDAASNRGIEEIKKLIKESSFIPMISRYRIFIIDEAHMITNEGFNAFLKTLEEPPKSVIFILATTNPEKIPTTIRSRTTIINFGKANKNDIIHMLKRIVNKENLNVSEEVLNLIAEQSENSFRDATKILEELTIQNILTDVNQVKKYIGLSRSDFLSILKTKNLKEILSWIKEFEDNNGNFKNLIQDTLNQLHQILLVNNKVIDDQLENNLNLTNKEITYLMKLLLEAYREIKNSPIESLPLEIAMVQYYNYLKDIDNQEH
jgi:DNA polymerase-3 subunit gamma/tau